MRWIVLTLFAGNLALFGWFSTAGREQSVTARVVMDAGSAGSIALVSEARPEDLAKSEADPGPSGSSSERASVAPVEAGSAAQVGAGESLCTLVGPFEEVYQGQDVVERMASLQVSARLREIEMQGQMRYWVFLAPLNSGKEAFRRLRELQAEGIDSYVIPKGSLENGISFGIFSEKVRATNLTEELQAQGVDAQYREEPQTYLERWVVLDGDDAQLAGNFWQQLQLDYPEVERRQNLCSEVRVSQ